MPSYGHRTSNSCARTGLSSLGEIAAGLAHEIGNPLAGVKGALEIITSRAADGSPEREFSTLASREIARLEGLIEEFLRFARPHEPRRSDVDIFDVLDRVVSLISREAADRGVSIQVNRTQVPPVSIDPEQMVQVFVNIVLNAVQVSPPGGRVEIAASTSDGMLAVDVRDEGPGIRPEHLGKSLRSVLQHEKTRDRTRPLHLEPHRAEPWRENRGPATRSWHGHSRSCCLSGPLGDEARSAESGRSDNMSDRKTILLIDDDDSLRRVVEYNLREEGYDVVTAAAGAEGLQLFQDRPVDLVLTDVRMPEMDGVDVLARLKAIQADLPVVMLTAHGTITSAVEAMKLGAFDYLTKPFDRERLKAVVRKALDMAALASENRQLRQVIAERFSFASMIAGSRAMRAVTDTAARVAQADTTVLLEGESGTGKELLAKAIHFHSSRARGPVRHDQLRRHSRTAARI